MKKRNRGVCMVGMLLMGWAHSSERLGDDYQINSATLSSATHLSHQGPFEIKALVGETGVGIYTNGQGPHQLISGLIQPNYDLIFKNDLE